MATKVRRGVPKIDDYKGPKKPASGAYFSWCNDNRERVSKIIQADPATTGKNFISLLGRTLAEKYKTECTEEMKAKYQEKNAELKKEYEIKLAAWKETPEAKQFEKARSDFAKKNKNKQAKADAKAGGMPGRPLASYFLFVNAKRDEISATLKARPGVNFQIKMVAQEAGRMWKAMTDEERKPWDEKAKLGREQYEVDLAAWKLTDGFKKYEEDNKKPAKPEKRTRKSKAEGEDGEAVEGEPKPKAMRTRKPKVEKTAETTESTPAASPATTEATVEESPAAPVKVATETAVTA